MKTFAQYLKEKWLTSVPNLYQNNKMVDVYLNPTHKEYKEAISASDDEFDRKHEMIRALVLDNGKGDVYIFDNHLLHAEAYDRVKMKVGKNPIVPLTLQQGKYFIVSSHTMQVMNQYVKSMPSKDKNFYKYVGEVMFPNLKSNRKLQRLSPQGFKEM